MGSLSLIMSPLDHAAYRNIPMPGLPSLQPLPLSIECLTLLSIGSFTSELSDRLVVALKDESEEGRAYVLVLPAEEPLPKRQLDAMSTIHGAGETSD